MSNYLGNLSSSHGTYLGISVSIYDDDSRDREDYCSKSRCGCKSDCYLPLNNSKIDCY